MMQRSGQATLSFIVLVGGIILQVAIAGSLVTYFFNASKFNERLELRSLSAAQAGIRDAQVRIARDSTYASTGSDSYSFGVGNDTVDVSVSRTPDSSTNTYTYTVTSIGNASGRQKQLIAVMITNQVTGLVEFKSLSEQSLP